MQAEGKKGMTRCGLRLEGRVIEGKRQSMFKRSGAFVPSAFARRGPGLPSRLAGPWGGAGTRQPKFLGQDPRGSVLALRGSGGQFDNDHVGADPDRIRWDITGNLYGAEMLADPWVVNALIFPGTASDPNPPTKLLSRRREID